MEISVLKNLVSDEQIRAICWTLVHSLWVGLITAGLAGGVLMVTQRASSRIRYQLLTGCLLVFVFMTGFMFFRESEVLVAGHAQTQSSPSQTLTQLVSTDVMTISRDWSLGSLSISFVNQNAARILIIWLVFFVLKSLNLISGLFYINRIRTRSTHPVSDEWREKLVDLGYTLGVGRSVALFQSELVKIPVTVGHLRPVILIPVGLLFQLPYEQVETILLHELAHIKRRDYLVNLFQSVLETLFFFNPGLLWLCALISEERETCCDDIVLAHTSVKRNYLEALLAFHTLNTQPNLVLGLGGNQLVNRLKRIINHENKRLNTMEKIVLLAGLLMVSAFSYMPNSEQPRRTVSFAKADHPEVNQNLVLENVTSKGEALSVKEKSLERSMEVSEPTLINEVPKDTNWKFQSFRFVNTNEDPANRDMEARDYKNNVYNLKIENSKVVSLKINGTQVPENELTNHQDLVAGIHKAWREAHDNKQLTIIRSRMYREKERANRELRTKNRDTTRLKFKNKDFARSKFEKSDDGLFKKDKIEKDRRKEEKWDLKQDKAWDKELKDSKEFKKDKDDLKHFKIEKRKDKEWKEDKKIRKEKAFSKGEFGSDSKSEQLAWAKGKGGGDKWKTATNEKERWSSDVEWSVIKREKLVDISHDQQRVRGVIAELIQEKVISKDNEVEWFGLSDGELVVNGNKQPAELQQKLKEKFGIRSGNGLYYGPVKMSGSGVFLDKGDL